jgi:hypothetical protein
MKAKMKNPRKRVNHQAHAQSRNQLTMRVPLIKFPNCPGRSKSIYRKSSKIRMECSSILMILKNTRRLESKIGWHLKSYRRMQNRESAVRSRMRKTTYQEELE